MPYCRRKRECLVLKRKNQSKMRSKILIVFFIVACSFHGWGQLNNVRLGDHVISVGYRGHFGGMEAYQSIAQFYNDNRPWLSNGLSENGYMHGIEVGLEYNAEKWGMSALKVYYNRKKNKAKGENNGNTYTRFINTSFLGIETVDFWYTPLNVRGVNFGFGVMPLGLGLFRVRTKLNDGDNEKIPLSDLEFNSPNLSFVRTSHMYVNIHADVTRVSPKTGQSFHLQFFYTIGPKQEYELFFLNKEINPTTYPSIRQRTLQKMNNFGMKLIFNF